MRKFIEHHREKQAELAAKPVKTPTGRQPKLKGFSRALEQDIAARTATSTTARNRRRRQRQRA